jgi:hypothetical protein
VEPVIVALAVSLVVVGAFATYLDGPKRRRKRAPTTGRFTTRFGQSRHRKV